MDRQRSNLAAALRTKEIVIAVISLVGIAVHLVLRSGILPSGTLFGMPGQEIPLLVALVCGAPLAVSLVAKTFKLEFSSNLLAVISIVTAVLLKEYLAGTIVVLMLASGQALEAYAVRRASFALDALAKRLPAFAHKKRGAVVDDIPLAEVVVGDQLVVFPHETCPADGTVIEGHSTMNESYLTGEPYLLPKAVGSAVLSGAINGEGA
jgi:cation transport ATPase